MLFNSLEFLFLFLPVVLLVARLLRGNALLFWISLVSFVFYAFAGHAWFLIPMAITTALDYWVGWRIHHSHTRASKRAYLLLSLICNLGLLGYFKYSGLLVETARELARLVGASQATTGQWSVLTVMLPAGISFYTFQTMSYVIDIYRGHNQPEPNFLKYVSFVTFFPHLVAGPLTRHDQLLPQLGRIATSGIRPQWRQGVFLFSLGLCKKVLIADRVANLIDPLIGAIGQHGLVGCWLAAIGYSMQIYFDFSGYSDMAVGLGRLFGIELPQNFDSPYQARDPSDFWKRWHITLSNWLRDYLYISLGGNRRGSGRTRFNLMATMILGGLWHGASWTFALWGLYHGLLLVLYHRFASSWSGLPTWLRRAQTYALVCIGWVFFRAPNLNVARSWLTGLAGGHGDGWAAARATAPLLSVLLAPCLVITMGLRNGFQRDWAGLPRLAIGLLAGATAIAILMMNYSSRFLYFQF